MDKKWERSDKQILLLCYFKYWTFCLEHKIWKHFELYENKKNPESLFDAWKITSKTVYALFKYLFKFNRVYAVYIVVHVQFMLLLLPEWTLWAFSHSSHSSPTRQSIAKPYFILFCLHNQLKFISLLLFFGIWACSLRVYTHTHTSSALQKIPICSMAFISRFHHKRKSFKTIVSLPSKYSVEYVQSLNAYRLKSIGMQTIIRHNMSGRERERKKIYINCGKILLPHRQRVCSDDKLCTFFHFIEFSQLVI